jgi:hypothetical protein
MATAAFHKKKQNLNNKVIYLSQGHFNGRATWHYLLVDKMKLPILLKESKSEQIDLTKYGNIVFSGFGENPPEEVRICVKNKYGTA